MIDPDTFHPGNDYDFLADGIAQLGSVQLGDDWPQEPYTRFREKYDWLRKAAIAKATRPLVVELAETSGLITKEKPAEYWVSLVVGSDRPLIDLTNQNMPADAGHDALRVELLADQEIIMIELLMTKWPTTDFTALAFESDEEYATAFRTMKMIADVKRQSQRLLQSGLVESWYVSDDGEWPVDIEPELWATAAGKDAIDNGQTIALASSSDNEPQYDTRVWIYVKKMPL